MIDRAGEAARGRAPQVSVIVPAFNAADFLDEAILSLRAQTLSDIEIIVVNDGSSDDTSVIAARHATEDPRVRVISRKEPSGSPAAARNRALAIASGRYIAFLDADDVSVPTRLESAVRALELTGVHFVFADMQRLYQDTGDLAEDSSLSSAAFLNHAAHYMRCVNGNIYLCEPGFSAFLLTYVAINTPTVVFHRDLLIREPNWFDETLVRFEDVDLWYRLAEHTRFAFVNEVHTIVRKHSASITAADPTRTRIDGIAVQSKHFARLRPSLSKVETKAAALHISGLMFDVAYAERTAGNESSSRRWFFESWKMRPTSAALAGFAKTFVPIARGR